MIRFSGKCYSGRGRPIDTEGGLLTFAAVVSLPSGKDGSGHSKRVKIDDFSAVPHGGSEPSFP